MRVVSGIEITTVSTTAQFPVGERFSVSQPASDLPPAIWMYVKATAELLQGNVCSWVASATGTAYVIGAPTGAAGLQVVSNIAGVAQHTIALGSYGFIQIGGVGEVGTAGGVAVNIGLGYPTTAKLGSTIGTAKEGSFAIVLVNEVTPQKCLITLAR
tara:strand:- start:44 stop:514 length:471 start_codon:yes stop_codon:yes gene_type:complete